MGFYPYITVMATSVAFNISRNIFRQFGRLLIVQITTIISVFVSHSVPYILVALSPVNYLCVVDNNTKNRREVQVLIWVFKTLMKIVGHKIFGNVWFF